MSYAASSGGESAAAGAGLLDAAEPSLSANAGEVKAAEMQKLIARLEVVAILGLGDGANFGTRSADGCGRGVKRPAHAVALSGEGAGRKSSALSRKP